MCNPFILNAAAWDFHPVTLAVPLIAIGYYALEYKNFRLLFVSCIVILLCKVHFGLLVVGFGLLWVIKHREFKRSLLLCLLGVSCFTLIIGVLMPMLSPTGELLMMSTGNGQVSRYGWLGSSAGEVFLKIINDPIAVIKTVFVSMHGWVYLFLLALPFLGFSIFELCSLLPGLADFAVNLLSSNGMPRSIYSYHSAALVPVFTVSAMYGLHRCSKFSRKGLALGVTVCCLSVSLFMGYSFSSFDVLPGSIKFWAPKRIVPYNDPVLLKVKALVGTHSATVQANTAVNLLVMRREEFFGLIRSEPVIATKLLWSFVQVLSGRLRETNEALQGAKRELAVTDDDAIEILFDDTDE